MAVFRLLKVEILIVGKGIQLMGISKLFSWNVIGNAL
jgi:hypothetical protein